jgi:hypothetical protein
MIPKERSKILTARSWRAALFESDRAKHFLALCGQPKAVQFLNTNAGDEPAL